MRKSILTSISMPIFARMMDTHLFSVQPRGEAPVIKRNPRKQPGMTDADLQRLDAAKEKRARKARKLERDARQA